MATIRHRTPKGLQVWRVRDMEAALCPSARAPTYRGDDRRNGRCGTLIARILARHQPNEIGHAEEMGSHTEDRDTALVVDVDGALLRTDLLWEGVIRLCVERPSRLGGLAVALARGREAAFDLVARETTISLESLPLEPAALQLIDEARAEGRAIRLVSRLGTLRLEPLAECLGATAEAKMPGRFDFLGDGKADEALWRAARRGFTVNRSASAVRKARRTRPDLEVIGERSPRWKAHL